VWDDPRPPRLETFVGSITVELGGKTIASNTRAWRALETSHPCAGRNEHHHAADGR
jgi:uncharacterized protein (DUF427 family)